MEWKVKSITETSQWHSHRFLFLDDSRVCSFQPRKFGIHGGRERQRVQKVGFLFRSWFVVSSAWTLRVRPFLWEKWSFFEDQGASCLGSVTQCHTMNLASSSLHPVLHFGAFFSHFLVLNNMYLTSMNYFIKSLGPKTGLYWRLRLWDVLKGFQSSCH